MSTSFFVKVDTDFKEVVKEIFAIVDGPVSAVVTSYDYEEMVKEARDIATWADNIVVKISMTEDGLKAVNTLSKEGLKTNCTLIFSVSQWLMADKAGATYISPFIGRIDDMGEDGIRLIKNLKTVLDNYGLESEIIAASIRTNKHLEDAALAGAHIATIPGTLFEKLWTHLLTTQGIDNFKKDRDSFIGKTK